MIDRTLSEKAALEADAQTSQCFRNASLAFTSMPELVDGLYIEGYAIHGKHGFLLEHGWIELDDGRIVDPTLYTRDVNYFPGLRFTRRQIEDAMRTSPELPVFYRFGYGGSNSPEMRKAFAMALAYSNAQFEC